MCLPLVYLNEIKSVSLLFIPLFFNCTISLHYIYIFRIFFCVYFLLLNSLQCSVKPWLLQICVLTTRLWDTLSIWQNLKKLYCKFHHYTLTFLKWHRLSQRQRLQLQGTRWHICQRLALEMTASMEDMCGCVLWFYTLLTDSQCFANMPVWHFSINLLVFINTNKKNK